MNDDKNEKDFRVRFPIMVTKATVFTKENQVEKVEDSFEEGMGNAFYQTSKFHPRPFHRFISKTIDLKNFNKDG